jgi:broad specificity phosphatase PhoE
VTIPTDLSATLVLLRHGESTYIVEERFQGRADSPLSPTGRHQAALTGARLADPGSAPALPIPTGSAVEIAHSPLERARATAAAVAAAIAERLDPVPPLRPEQDLSEISQGEWEGLTRSEVEARDLEVLLAWRRDATTAEAPGGERVVDAAVRARAGVERAIAHLRDATDPDPDALRGSLVEGYLGSGRPRPWSLLVAHDGILKLVLLALLDLPLERFWSFPFALCGITVVELRAGRALLRAHNRVEHLASIEIAAEARTAGRVVAYDVAVPEERGGAL